MSDLQEMGDEELIDELEAEVSDFGDERRGLSIASSYELRAEILRRMSTGCPQAEGEQSWAFCPEYADGRTHICCAAIERQRSRPDLFAEPERSDGRVQGEGCFGIQRQCDHRYTANMQGARWCLLCKTQLTTAEAQRSAGRVQAGSVAFPVACYSCGEVHDALATCQVSENGAVPHEDDDNKS